MTRKYVQYFVLVVFLSVASCNSIYNQIQTKQFNGNVLIPRTTDEEKKPTKDDFAYVVSNKRNIPCTLADMLITIKIPDKKNLTVPKGAKTEGVCSDIISIMKLTWKVSNDSEDHVLTFTFINDHSTFSLFSINANIPVDKNTPPSLFEDSKKPLIYKSENDLRLFAAPVKNGYYKCNDKISKKVGELELTFKNVTLIAFNSDKDFSTRKETSCAKETPKPTFPYVLKSDKKVCTLAKMSISLDVPYSKKDSGVAHGVINIPSDAEVSGNCGDGLTEMNLIWPKKAKDELTFDSNTEQNRVKFQIIKNNGLAYIYAIGLDISLDEKNFPGATEKRKLDQTPLSFNSLFAASANNGLYSCADVTTVNLMSSTMNISDVLLVAYGAENDFSEKKVVNCESQYPLSESDFEYVVSDGSMDAPCILANMTITMQISNKSGDSKPALVPKNINVTGSCDEPVTTMVLKWPVPGEKEKTNTISFRVGENQTTYFVYEIDVDVYLDKTNFANAAESGKRIIDAGFNLDLFATPMNGLYNCTNVDHAIKLKDIEMNITDVVFVAFNTEKDLSKKTVQSCAGDVITSTTEPISTDNPTEPSPNPSIPSSSTPQPEPDPSVKVFQYYYMDPKTKVVCIAMNANISFTVSYDLKDSGTDKTKLNVPLNPRIDGKCDSSTSMIKFSWREVNDINTPENEVTFAFGKDNSKYFPDTLNIILNTDTKNFHNPKETKYEESAKVRDLFSAPVKHLFKCKHLTEIKLGSVDVSISDVALIAFNTESKVSWESEQNCESSEDETDVGAIVGGIIGGLILIGLIVFGVIMYRKRRRMV